MSHTEGDWHAEVPASSSGFTRAIYAQVDEDADDILVAYVGDWRQPPDVEVANAALIAAAPKMLAALRDVVSALNGRVHSTPALSALSSAEEAIAKAEGRLK